MEPVRIDLLPPEVPTWALVVLVVAASGLWVGARVWTWRHRARLPRFAVWVARGVTAVAAAWCLLQLIGRVAVYACAWPLWVAALLLGLGVETAAIAFGRERLALAPRTGRAVLALRALAIALVALMLMQPVLMRYAERKVSRRVAVLVDGSGSMRFTDRQWQPREHLAWASHLGLLDEARRQRLADAPDDAPALWDELPEADRDRVRAWCETSRVALASSLLTQPAAGGPSLLDRLSARYDLDLFAFGRRLARITAADLATGLAVTGAHSFVEARFQSATDITAALEAVLREIPTEQLAGVLLLSDGIHNAEPSVLPVTRRFGALGAPVASVLIGGTRLPFDLALADVAAPESVFLGDRVRLTATVRATGAMGRRAALRLLLDQEVVEETTLEISSDDWRSEVRFSHEPATNGIVRYDVRLDTFAEELFADNNGWRAEVAVSDDRINVLLVDDVPRWEFRYLRNLFFGRDKSVHLQAWLARPDRLAGENAAPLPAASAARRFGDAEAGGWPETTEAWRAFDVIIIGDLGPEILTPAIQEEIRGCVAERGALLVVLAGPAAMPHAFGPEAPLSELLPFVAQPRTDYFRPPETAFRLALTPGGQGHPVMLQSASLSENEEIWRALPLFDWRLPVTARPGAEILAVAEPADGAPERVLSDVRLAVEHLEEIMQQRSRQAVIVAQSHGRGKVLGLAFDRTWRMRYRTGDLIHHRFWGQALRWGLGERLRAGQERFRVGTDQLVYAPDEPIRVVARVLDETFAGIEHARLEATLRDADGREITRLLLTPRPGAHGFYEGVLPPMPRPGSCVLDVARLDAPGGERVETSLLVTASRRPIEMGEVRPTPDVLQALARGTGGRVVGPDEAAELVDLFGAGRQVVVERWEYPLWNNLYVLLLLAALLTAEWALRKKGGLV